MNRTPKSKPTLDEQANDWMFGFLSSAAKRYDADGVPITSDILDEAWSDAVGVWPAEFGEIHVEPDEAGDGDRRFTESYEYASKLILAGRRP